MLGGLAGGPIGVGIVGWGVWIGPPWGENGAWTWDGGGYGLELGFVLGAWPPVVGIIR